MFHTFSLLSKKIYAETHLNSHYRLTREYIERHIEILVKLSNYINFRNVTKELKKRKKTLISHSIRCLMLLQIQ
jgi:hypothetical protein